MRKIIGQYRVYTNELLGKGTFGEVYRAEIIENGKQIAVKVMDYNDIDENLVE